MANIPSQGVISNIMKTHGFYVCISRNIVHEVENHRYSTEMGGQTVMVRMVIFKMFDDDQTAVSCLAVTSDIHIQIVYILFQVVHKFI